MIYIYIIPNIGSIIDYHQPTGLLNTAQMGLSEVFCGVPWQIGQEESVRSMQNCKMKIGKYRKAVRLTKETGHHDLKQR